MTDFFALLEQPRQPWLDPNALKQKYHQLTRAAHPDVRSDEPRAEFGIINEAYRVLLDPKLRIQHLLALESSAPSAVGRALPEDLEELFLKIGTFSQKSQDVLAQIRDARGALSRSLLKSDLLDLRSQTTELSEQLSRSYETCLGELQQLNQLWTQNQPQAVPRLQQLHDRIAYLSRWIAKLEENQFQLSLHD